MAGLGQPGTGAELYAQLFALGALESVGLCLEEEASGGVQQWVGHCRLALRSSARTAPGISDLAARHGVGREHLARSFRKAYGVSPARFRLLQKLRLDRRLLQRTDHALSHVAFDSGFSDQSHLTREFRLAYGITPHAFRQALRTMDRSGRPAVHL